MITLTLALLQAAPVTSRTGTFQSPRVIESSGVAVSRAHRGVLWTHNDSGDGPYVYATDTAGTDRGALLVPGADAVDWEDMALGPCPNAAGDCLYLADTGDNLERRPSVTVYAVAEPAPPVAPADTQRTTAAPAVLRLRYPDGPHDVEAIFVSFRDGALYLVSKGRSGPIRLYRVPRAAWGGDSTVVATQVQELPIVPDRDAGRWVTGAAMRRDGRLVAVRTYTDIHFFTPTGGGRLLPAARPACVIGAIEEQGEAIDFLDNSTLVLTSEAYRAPRGTIHAVQCP
ncbi:MAG: hypothetical protein HYS40_08060 [Gemmatimonadetes bacterium]|nr:hypothetical protein [Gemmatimonadota bacterium]